MPRVKGPLEGKSHARDESRITEEHITLDAFFEVLEESLEIQNQVFGELIEKIDVIDKRPKDQDRRFQERDQRLEPREQLFQRRDDKSVEMKQDLRRNCKTGGLPGQQARPEDEDAYGEGSGESEDNSTADEGKHVAPSRRRLEREPDLGQQTCIGQQENNLVTISRHVESDNDGGSSPHEATLKDPPHGENLNVEPVVQSAGVKDVEPPFNQEKATCTSPKTQHGRIHPRWQLKMPQRKTNAELFGIGLFGKTRRQT